MKIAVLNYHRMGGSGIVAYELGRAMAEEMGHGVHFVGLEPPFRLGEQYSDRIHFHKVWLNEYPVFNYPPYTLALASQLSDLIVKYNIDIIHSHYALPHAVAALLARDISGRNVKCVTTLHGTDITVVGAHPTMKNITCHALMKCDAITAVSNYLRIETENIFGMPEGRIQTIYNFLNPEFFNPGLEKKDQLNPENDFICLHISNLRKVKQPLDVIRIFHGLSTKSSRSMKLWILGEGPMQSEMMILAGALGIEKQVQFMGIRTNIGPIVASANLLIMPSMEESFGLSALEAMACGVPVVAACAGGLPEVVKDRETGILFPTGDIDAAIENALRLVNDPRLLEEMGKKAAKHAVETFNMNAIVNQYNELYETVLAGKEKGE
ncbi:MAG: N-acetyl-alpha-D-glucosaminyl L-malate synthase BshA [Acidobacteria bacterium CG_4_9_14_3_um_filter_49_7]|nr:MAG: N-acetyl-alpha-D-glucosaminyl L-malate synthase BshA [Acidobacteria bacterium CG_4_9_14_3_um_filter_49_7]